MVVVGAIQLSEQFVEDIGVLSRFYLVPSGIRNWTLFFRQRFFLSDFIFSDEKTHLLPVCYQIALNLLRDESFCPVKRE